MRSDVDICEVLRAFQAIFARLLFLVHSVFAIWGATCVTGRPVLWSLTVLCGFFVLETAYSIVKRKGREPKWFSPCVFIYLMTVIPPIWLLRLDYLRCTTSTIDKISDYAQCIGFTGNNFTYCSIITLNNAFDRKTLVYTIEQLMLLLLIVGRWMLPKGVISRDQLSQLLLVYFGMAFDIMEVFYLFDEIPVMRRPSLQYTILAIWTVSLLQFTIVLTTVKTNRQRLSREMRGAHGILHRMTQWRCCQTEFWGIIAIVVLQDGPFLILRLYCFGLGIFSYNLLFYTVKNVLIIILQSYRCIVILLRSCLPGFDQRAPRKEPTVSVIGPTATSIQWKDRAPGSATPSDERTLDLSSRSSDDRLSGRRRQASVDDFNFITTV